VTAAAIIVDGELENRSDAPAEVIFFSGLHLVPVGDTLKLRADLPPRPPPVPPPPMRMELAPHARAPFSAAISLGEYTFASGATVVLEWSFGYWTGEKPGGRLEVTLP
jgi:hypothetical protein